MLREVVRQRMPTGIAEAIHPCYEKLQPTTKRFLVRSRTNGKSLVGHERSLSFCLGTASRLGWTVTRTKCASATRESATKAT